ncbi:hypothetical protein HETIRDRAFT_168611 [Heterobasidion irregulare TC 32-1]|uniref:Uncharacterized protein n=1 Tax=Heterobasidion irregulare (strain TC 32-1) TaxID=747525 RepID=W4KGZ0_HETIT|nr:uncharacterized protein HETIRDRAFT_168611 [Heterobasidion irregulare TC 32-1]ETW85117.1 hypothetical protein HETIRDRAFT_168611 [Heterobasidion irregulare TC 32-1]
MDTSAATHASQDWIALGSQDSVVPTPDCDTFPTPDLHTGLDFSRDLYAPWEPEYKVFEIVWVSVAAVSWISRSGIRGIELLLIVIWFQAARDAALMAFGGWDDDDTPADSSSERAFSVLDSPSFSAHALSIDRAPSPGHARGEVHTCRTSGKSRKRQALPEDYFSEGTRPRKRSKAAAHEAATSGAQTEAAQVSQSGPTLQAEVKASLESTNISNKYHDEDDLLTEVPQVEAIPSTSARPSPQLAEEAGILFLPVEEEAGVEDEEPSDNTREGDDGAHESSGGDGEAHVEARSQSGENKKDAGNDAGDGASDKDEESSQKKKRGVFCEVHNKFFADRSSFARHRRTTEGHPQYQGKVKCEWCGTLVSRGDAMKRHLSDTCRGRHRDLVE